MRTSRSLLMVSVLTLVMGSFAPVTAQSPAATEVPTSFTGHLVAGPVVRAGTEETVGDHSEARGSIWSPRVVDMTDPRMDGRVQYGWEANGYVTSDGAWYDLVTETWRIETDEGAWQGSYTGVESAGWSRIRTSLLAGEGAYEGMWAFWESNPGSDGWAVRGVILPDAPLAPTVFPQD